MWFKNLTLFRFAEPVAVTAGELAEKLGHAVFYPCASQEMVSLGWVPPLGPKATDLVHAVNGCSLLCLQVEEKVLPAAVVREAIAAKVTSIQEQQMRTVRRHEKDAIRDEIMQDLLPRAFSRRRQSHAYIDPRGGWLVVNSASRRTVEELTGLLRKTVGSLPIMPLRVASAPASVMTGWLAQGELAADFELGDECELRDAGEAGGIVRCKGQDLAGEEIRGHLQAGKQVTRLALSWDERIAFVLGEDLSIRRLRFLDLVREQLDDTSAETVEAQCDAEFTLMSGELALFLHRLLEVFGGEAR